MVGLVEGRRSDLDWKVQMYMREQKRGFDGSDRGFAERRAFGVSIARAAF